MRFRKMKDFKGNRMKRDKMEIYYNLMEHWFTIHEQGKTIPGILMEQGIKKIALYGMGKIGKHVIYEIKNSEVKVAYGIEKNKTGFYDGLQIKSIDDEFPQVDAIIVTAIYDFDEIERDLKNRVNYPVISLEQIIYEG